MKGQEIFHKLERQYRSPHESRTDRKPCSACEYTVPPMLTLNVLSTPIIIRCVIVPVDACISVASTVMAHLPIG
ncbi:MAG: hypothetical protein CM15mV9_2510 [uncultured marine virus]|nr:MAG: hypothetical protein CM15mV9_2510 [uncultured marine virus]